MIISRAQFKMLALTYKALYSFGPGYLKDRLRQYHPSHILSSAKEAIPCALLADEAQLVTGY